MIRPDGSGFRRLTPGGSDIGLFEWAPDGSRIYITEEPTKTLDVVDAASLKITKKIKLSGRPNNVAVSNDGRKVYVGIAQAPGAVDVIDAGSLANIKSIPVDGAVHNVYVTPDGRFAVSGSVAKSVISVIDAETDKVVWSLKLSRPGCTCQERAATWLTRIAPALRKTTAKVPTSSAR